MREIFIERREKLIRIAIKDNGKLTECFIEEENEEASPGQLYKGIVKNIVPAIKSAFIDIGLGKNAYMYMDSKFGNTRLKKGEELVVEVIKEEIGDKGAKVTSAINIAGRYSVLTTMNGNINFSSKITDEEFKQSMVKELIKPQDLGISDKIGVMIRTNAQSVTIHHINRELNSLYETYCSVMQKARYSARPGLLYSDEGVLDRILRDYVNEATSSIVTDSQSDSEYIKRFIEDKSDIEVKTELYESHRTLFDYFGIEKEILSLRNNRVNLSCGGHIFIERTEAMYVIDVNSGKNISGSSMQKTILVTNIQAAEEICVQVRLRNLSGIIVIDFIDMASEEERAKVLATLRRGFADDKNKTVIYPFTELNLVQIARRRRGKNIYEYMEDSCIQCRGKGKLLKKDYLFLLIKNEILRVDSEDRIKDMYIEVNEMYKDSINEDILTFIKEVSCLDKKIYLNFTHLVEYFKVEPLIFLKQIENVEKFKIYG